MARDALGPVLAELRLFIGATGGAFSTVPIRGGEPQPTDKPPYVLVTHASQYRRRRYGVTDQRLNIRSYGVTPQSASELARLVSDCLHDAGPRVHGTGECNRTGIYQSSEEVGAQAAQDPDTGWVYELAVYNAVVAAPGV